MYPTKLLFFVVIFGLSAVSAFSQTPAASGSPPLKPIELGETVKSSSSLAKSDCSVVPNLKGDTFAESLALKSFLQKYVDGKRAAGIAVGWVTREGRCIVAVGDSGNKARPAIDGDTRFEIGSISKVFTGALLADMVAKGELKVDDPIGPYLPESARSNAALAAITFAQLTTHTAGVARLPQSWSMYKALFRNPNDPYRNYTREQFIEDLVTMKAGATETSEYSNAGVALLGLVLEARAGQTYETLVKTRLLNPLSMNATMIYPPTSDDPLLAVGHSAELNQVSDWQLGVFTPAGGIRSNVNDLLKVIDASLAGKAPWAAAQTQLKPLGKTGGIGYNWMMSRLQSEQNGQLQPDTLVWHNGGTGGFSTFIGVDRERGIGAVVLTNTADYALATELGRRLWDARNPTPSFEREKTALGWFAGSVILSLALAVVFASVVLAGRARATQREFATSSDPSLTLSEPTQKKSLVQRTFSTPLIDRVDVLLRAVYGFAATAFVNVFVPPIAVVGALTVPMLLYALFTTAAVYAIWVSRGVQWWKGGGVKRWLSIALSTLLSVLFAWIGLA